jgi:SAM-dependent methyltransferase
MDVDDWERFYEDLDYDRCAYLEGEAMVDYAEALFDRVGIPETVLSVGCGPAVVEFELADRYPGVAFDCVDAAPGVVADDRELAREAGLDNLSFSVAELPALDLGRRYDLVYCVATLYFVADVEAALRALDDHVAPGGTLVASYPDERLREWVREQEGPKRDFFQLVEAGENLLTRGEVERILGRPVEEYWSLLDREVDRTGTVFVRG